MALKTLDDIINTMQTLDSSSSSGGASDSNNTSSAIGTGTGGSDGNNNLLKCVIIAPWDLSVLSKRKGKPSPEQTSLVRTLCESHDAGKDLRQTAANHLRRAEIEFDG